MGSDQSKDDDVLKQKKGSKHPGQQPNTADSPNGRGGRGEGSSQSIAANHHPPPQQDRRTTSPNRTPHAQRDQHEQRQHHQQDDLQNAPSALDSPAMAQSPCEFSEHDADSALMLGQGGRCIPPVPLAANDLNIICFNFQHPPIGQGGFSTVYEGIFRDVPVAVKMLAIRNPSEHALFQAELAVLLNENIRHPNLLPLVAYCQERPALVMPRLKPLNRERLPRLPGSVRMRVSIDVARGLAHLHAAGFVHNDMKPDNVLLEFDAQRHIRRALVGDLGCAKLTSIPVQPFGTMLFMDPALNPSGPPVHPKPADDVYSFGLTLVCIFTNAFPEHQQDLVRMWATVDTTFPLVSNLARQMTHPDPRMRPTCASVADALTRMDAGWRDTIEQQQRMLLPQAAGGGGGVQPPPPPPQQQQHQQPPQQRIMMMMPSSQQQQHPVGPYQAQPQMHQPQSQRSGVNYATPPPSGAGGGGTAMGYQQSYHGGGAAPAPQQQQHHVVAGYTPSSQRQPQPVPQQHQYYQQPQQPQNQCQQPQQVPQQFQPAPQQMGYIPAGMQQQHQQPWQLPPGAARPPQGNAARNV